MGRRRKSDEEKALEQLRKWAEKEGGTLDMSALGLSIDSGINRETKAFKSRELDAVARYLRSPKSMLTKVCYGCKSEFKTDWENVGCCSVECYVNWFEGTTGIKPNLAERRMWRFERPLVISADSLTQIREWAAAILEDAQTPVTVEEITPEPPVIQDEEPPVESSVASFVPSKLPQFP